MASYNTATDSRTIGVRTLRDPQRSVVETIGRRRGASPPLRDETRCIGRPNTTQGRVRRLLFRDLSIRGTEFIHKSAEFRPAFSEEARLEGAKQDPIEAYTRAVPHFESQGS